MALFPTSPSDGDQTTINGITYVYASATQSWTRVPTAAWQVGNGNSSLSFATNGGNANVSIGGTSNVIVVTNTSTNFAGNLLPSSNVTYSLGSTTQRWKDLWISNSTIYIGETTLAATGNTLTVGGNAVVTSSGSSGNATVGNIFANGYYWANGVVFGGGGGGTPGGANTYVQFNDNGAFNGTAGLVFDKTSNTLSTTGNINGGNLNVTSWVTAANVSASGNVFVDGYISVVGNLYVANIVSTSNLVVTDPLVYFQSTQSYPYNYDIGFYSAFTGGTGNTYQHTGFIRDYHDSVWKLFSNVPEPDGSAMDLTNAIYDVLLAGTYSATGNVSAVGNVEGGNLLTSGIVSASSYIGSVVSVTGNITGSYIIGNGSQLTGLPAGYTNSNVSTFLAAFGSNTISTTGNVTAGNVIQAGNRVALWTTSNTTPTNSVQGDQWYVPSSDKLYLYVNDGTSNTWVDQSQTTSFSTLAVTGNTTIGANLGVTGNITTGNLTVGTGAITFGTATNAGANGTGNIGSSTGYFNTVFAKATSAQYADIAEKYSSDYPYEPGTVVVFGGEQEVTLATKPNDNSVAGVVSTNPAYIMNAGIQAAYIVQVALTGRVPTKVLGPVRKGNMMVSAGNGYAQACATPTIGTIIGKSIENFDGDQGMIEIVVGRI